MVKGKKILYGLLSVCATALVGVSLSGVTTPTASYTKAINAGASYIKTKTTKSDLDAWDALAVKRSPYGMSSKAKAVFKKELAAHFKSLDGHYSAVDYERSMIGALSIGSNPEKYESTNLVSGIIKTAPKSNAGINGKIWGIIALSSKNYGSKSNAAVKTLVSQVVKAQNSAGGWAISGTASDVDVTGMALMALSMHKSYSGVKTAISKATSLLKNKAYQKSGDFIIASAFTTKANSDSNAMALAGLSAAGVNTDTYKGTSSITPVKRLMKFQKSTGQFRWLWNSNTGALHMSTQQATYALEQYRNYKLHKGSIFSF
ncbi:prenyltransferase/squalene oxidase repeat-containing protein [Secundilactobacillus paracollinoides]|uniref:Squalene cyclase C-terminal domain-containing protein n=1 Tax=Secundilactobacillus paracollinoides TaxID=240427 RepID=A0A1B2IW83_9LACO|nr:hypothetical protein [Secundilactobacillus paracollinoides]ANZ60476.1 hypothetical protein AYR61_03370 [Secundilactobacillus paracollinoides]ANZ66303.1 hypothetical protein AYR63_03565 [Secundilactobacillus paracollinoides]